MSAPGTSDGAFDRITVERVPQDATGLALARRGPSPGL